VPGGFGGGGGASIYDPYEAIGGGGGGYSGGGSGATRIGAGGGGGNYYTGTYVSDSLNTGDGFLKIQLVALPTVNMEISGNPSLVKKGEVVNLLATIDEAGTLTFFADGKRIPGCINRSANVGTFTCNWKPAIQGSVKLKVSFKQAGSEVANAQRSISVTKRTSTR
jgi:hypothetical protein